MLSFPTPQYNCSAVHRGFRGKNREITKGLKWLTRSVHFRSGALAARIERDVAVQTAKMKARRLARMRARQAAERLIINYEMQITSTLLKTFMQCS